MAASVVKRVVHTAGLSIKYSTNRHQQCLTIGGGGGGGLGLDFLNSPRQRVNNATCNGFLASAHQVRHYAARKGTRQKLESKKKKVKSEKTEEKKEFVPYKTILLQREMAKFKKRSEYGKRLLDQPVDDVYRIACYKWQYQSLEAAIQMHRESHHPTIYNEPNAFINVLLQLDMSLQKKNKFLEDFTSFVRVPHNFDHAPPRRVIAFCKVPKYAEEARTAGALEVGGEDLIKKIQSGAMSTDEFDFAICTPEILSEMIPIRGILKKRFPTKQKGTITFEIAKMVDYLMHGVEYTTKTDVHEHEHGSAEIPFGRLPMPVEHLEANLDAVVKEICTRRKAELGPFIRMAFITCTPSQEKLPISHEQYLPLQVTNKIEEDIEAQAVN